jgi:hypothetical protein
MTHGLHYGQLAVAESAGHLQADNPVAVTREIREFLSDHFANISDAVGDESPR